METKFYTIEAKLKVKRTRLLEIFSHLLENDSSNTLYLLIIDFFNVPHNIEIAEINQTDNSIKKRHSIIHDCIIEYKKENYYHSVNLKNEFIPKLRIKYAVDFLSESKNEYVEMIIVSLINYSDVIYLKDIRDEDKEVRSYLT